MSTVRQESDSFSDLLARWMERREHDGKTMNGRLAAGAALGVSHQTIANWLAGGLPPSTRIVPLAEGLGVGREKLRLLVARDRERRDAPVEKA